MDASEESRGRLGEVVSPFADAQGLVPERNGRRTRTGWIAGIALIFVILGALGGWLAVRYMSDPLRTLEAFPVGKYLEDYKGLAGSRFKGSFRVDADLGWKDGVGRLMLFTAPDDDRPVAVLIPAGVANGTFFEKGQAYLLALEVKEGGLVYAQSCSKN